MFICTPCDSKILPEKYRAPAEKVFPQGGYPEGKEPTLDAVKAFANMLGIDGDFNKMWDARSSSKPITQFLELFQNNLDLLIQKTWVEKAEEMRKENLEDKVLPFVELIEKGNYLEALKEFGVILDELAYLLFGAQSLKSDFTEYALRIDVRMGLFWWYGGQINGAPDYIMRLDNNLLYALLLLGICYLTDF